MEISLDGYRFGRLLRRSVSSEVWTAVREADGMAVVAKVFSIEKRPGLEARVEHEFELIRRLEVPGVVRALACERSGRHLYLLLEAHQGIELSEFAKGRQLPLESFFAIACRLSSILADVHVQRVVHRDIKPSNVLVDPDGGNVTLVDFGISVLLESERANIDDLLTIRGTLAYSSPEQTGRIGREVDYRSDLYSLGVTFYELLTGRLPFVAESSLELIHAHLARQPESPQRLRPDLPPALSRLIFKLLSKVPERRYQSARGLLDDLERMCEAHASGTLRDRFELGRADVPTSIRLPHQLYGRDRQRAELRAGLRHSLAQPPVFVMLEGEPGLGKSAMLDELVEQTMAYSGRLARGRFEPGRDDPLLGLSLALNALADQLLTAPQDELDRWRSRLAEALGPLTSTLCEVAPGFLALMPGGATEPDEQLGPETARNRMRQACVRVLEELAEPEHPLVLALDDMQWADAATLDVLESLAASQRLGMFIVMTSRPEALVQPDGSLVEFVAARAERVGSEEAGIRRIELAPLDEEQTIEMLADTLSLAGEQVSELARVVLRKTGGNPFFTSQFLVHLGDRELIRRGPLRWEWDLEELSRAALPDSALEMLTRKLRRLDARALELLLAASVLGAEIDPTLLGHILDIGDAAPRLLHLVDEGLLSTAPGGNFRFVHGRVREAAYAMLEPARRRKWHRGMGEALLVTLRAQEVEVYMFDLVEHLDRGYGLWPETEAGPAETEEHDPLEGLSERARTELAELNLRAGRRALATGAPASAKVYLGIAEQLLDTNSKQGLATKLAQRELELGVQMGLAQAETSTRASAAADRRLCALLEQDLSVLERGRVARIRCATLISNMQPSEAVDFTLEILAEFGVSLTREVSPEAIARTSRELDAMIPADELHRLSALPPLTDARFEVLMELLIEVTPASYLVAPKLFVVLVAEQARLLLEHGAHPALPVVFSQIATIFAHGLGQRERALELVAACFELAAGGRWAHRVALLHVFLKVWSQPLAELAGELEQIFMTALGLGDAALAARALVNEINLAFWGGMHLRLVETRVAARQRWVDQWGIRSAAPGGRELSTVCRRLIEGPAPGFEDGDPMGCLEAPLGPRKRMDLEVQTALLLGVFGCWKQVHTLLDGKLESIGRLAPDTWWVSAARVLWSLSCAEMARKAKDPRRAQLRAQLAESAKTMHAWVESGGYFSDRAALLDAELAVLDGDLEAASSAYDQAYDFALAQGNPIYAAMASERYAEAMHFLGHARLAIGPLLDASERYSSWGALAKTESLARRWPELAQLREPRGGEGSASRKRGFGDSTSTSTSTSTTAIDAASLLKASQTLAEDLRFPDVIGRVMNIALENAGAQRCVLMLATKGKLVYAAEATLDQTHAVLDKTLALAEVADRVPASLLRYVLRTREAIVLRAAGEDGRFAGDPYFRGLGGHARDGLSILCMPIIRRRRPVGLFYFENQLGTGVFSDERLELLNLLAGHAGSALENARLYEHLRDSEIRWRSLVDQLPDYVVLLRSDGNLEYINALARPQMRSGVRFDARKFVSAETSPEVSAAVGRAFAKGRQERVEVRLELEPDQPRWYVARIAPIMMGESIDRVLVVATDIDDRKQAEAARDGFEAQLRQQQRLDSIGTLASGVAHEINNPVQGIMNYAELIGNSEVADDMIREFAGEIGHETRRVATIVRHLLAFARQEFSEVGEATSLDEIVEGTMSLIGAIVRRDQIQLEIDLAPDLPAVHCRRQQIQQVMMNLVTNARDALNVRYPSYDSDKRIDISASAFEREGERWIALVVSDRGGGIPEPVLAHIFDPFFTTKGRDQGTGLGLSVSHGIITDHGGRLVIDNQVGVGASFTIELPCDASVRMREARRSR